MNQMVANWPKNGGSPKSMNPVKLAQKIKVIENMWISMRDGCRLAARVWMPVDAANKPVPAILEYLPYRKRDGTAERDELTHPYFAAYGYACVRVDMRGNGDSDGLMFDEYAQQEQDDALEVIAFLASQPWCSGRVGMIGISWGGFNALQIAARRPPALKAIVSICSTDDRYADDIHYMGGCLLNYNLGWATTMLAYSSRPPDPMIVGENWQKIWLNRLENLPHLAETWLKHQTRDAYWKHGSICENYSDIEIPTLLVGGWADGYSNAIFRMVENLTCPIKAVIGPWAHKYPHFAKPGPQVGFLQECLRWWDYWLKNIETGIVHEPTVRLYMQESLPPQSFFEDVPGRWISEPKWPPRNVNLKTYYLANGILQDTPGRGVMTVSSPQTVGAHGGRWFAFGTGPELPLDQDIDDRGSVTFVSEPLQNRTEICGAPVLSIEVSSDQSHAFLAARLCDLRPDNQTSRITYGILNLTHHACHENPKPLVAGQIYRINIRMNEIAWALPPSHRLCLSLSNAYWPLVWPSPRRNKLAVHLENSQLHLPIRPIRQEQQIRFPSPECAPPLEQIILRNPALDWTIKRNPDNGSVITRNKDDYGECIILPHGLQTSLIGQETWRIGADDPLSARADLSWQMFTGRRDWHVTSDIHSAMWSDENWFYMTAKIQATHCADVVFDKSWNTRTPRVFL